eukprot:3554032-Lingulodinium_polyedra.AAC.1
MARSNQRFAVATARETQTRAPHAQTANWSAHGARDRAVWEPPQGTGRRCTRIIVQRAAGGNG